MMSAYIESRNTNQCRSYFAKLKKKFSKLSEMMEFFGKNFEGLEKSVNELREDLDKFDSKFDKNLSFKNTSDEKVKQSIGGDDEKGRMIENVRTGTEYHQNEESEILVKRKYGSMPEKFFKLFYWKIFVAEEQSREHMNGNFLNWGAHSK